MKRKLAILLWVICFVHIASNLEAYWLRHKAGLPFRFLPDKEDQ